jgi:phosphoglycolate phosphatase
MASGELADATIVFDLDGTLVDTAPDLVRALNQTLDLEGLPQVKLETVRGLVGRGARTLIERAAGLSGVNFSADRLAQLTAAFIEFYRADISRHSTIFPGVGLALDELAALGAKFSVCTNKRTDLSVQLLEALGLAERFSAIVGADAVSDCKPHPDHFRAAVTARAAGAPVVVVEFGYSNGDAEKLGGDALLPRFSELPPLARRLLGRSP